jgi:hypothetical protein
MSSAAFTVNGGSPTGGVAVAASSTVTLALASTSGVNSVAWSIAGNHSEAATDPTITAAGLGASFVMPVGAGQAYLVRAVINGGRDASGRRQSGYTFQAVVGVNDATGALPFAAGETTERSLTHGYVPALNTRLATVGTGTAATTSFDPTIGGVLDPGTTDVQGAIDETYTAVYNAFSDAMSDAGLGSGTADKLTYWSGTGVVASDAYLTRTTNGSNGRGLVVGGSGTTGADIASVTARGDLSKFVLAAADNDPKASFSLISGNAYLISADTASGLNVAGYDPLDVTVVLAPETVAATDVANSASLVVSENLDDGYMYRGHFTVTARNAAGTRYKCDRVVWVYRVSSTVTILEQSALGTNSTGTALVFSDGGSGDLDATFTNTTGATVKARVNYSFTRDLQPASP